VQNVGNCVGKTQLSIIIIGACGEGGRLTTIAPNLQASLEKNATFIWFESQDWTQTICLKSNIFLKV